MNWWRSPEEFHHEYAWMRNAIAAAFNFTSVNSRLYTDANVIAPPVASPSSAPQCSNMYKAVRGGAGVPCANGQGSRHGCHGYTGRCGPCD
jgi:hypothetical protein